MEQADHRLLYISTYQRLSFHRRGKGKHCWEDLGTSADNKTEIVLSHFVGKQQILPTSAHMKLELCEKF